MNEFSEILINWYRINKRDLPWRNTNDPYLIWLSEIILQQTRVDQGLPYYMKFAATFPTIKHLAKASQDEVLRLWQGLGYYSRGRNLHFTANQIVHEFGGKFPVNYEDLIKLKGVGAYTAAAIASFSTNQHHAVVDGNVYRVLARYFGIESDISINATKHEFQSLANELLPTKMPGLFNQAIMEFGALQCVPKNPNCLVCPLQNSCLANKLKKVSLLPIKSKKAKVKKRYFYYLVIKKGNKTLIKKRNAGDIWEGLYEFPLIETKNDMNEQAILNTEEFKSVMKSNKFEIVCVSKQFKHQLTHQTIYCQFFELKVNAFANITDFETVVWSALDKYPKPILIQRFFLNN